MAVDNLGGVGATSEITVYVTENTPPTVQLYFVHGDHLNTPRLVANQQGQTVWRWDQQEPFGVNVPDENPEGLGAFEFPLRFPGQYFDKETNLHYNYFRDYDPSIGRYIQSDPIGLSGGLNTYSYVKNSPLMWGDPTGLDATVCLYTGGTGHVGIGVNSNATTGFYPQNRNVGALTGTDPGVVKPDSGRSSAPKICMRAIPLPANLHNLRYRAA